MNGIDFFNLDIHAAPCTNHCRHCWIRGSNLHSTVPARQVVFILEKLSELRSHIPYCSFFLYDEPTAHPDFLDIMDAADGLGLIGDSSFLATNGSVLATSPEPYWERLRGTGLKLLQLTVYGQEATHDLFAGRKGAFRDIITTIHRADTHHLEWTAGVIIHDGNASELHQTMRDLRALDPGGRAAIGSFVFSWQGRGRDAGRIHKDQYDALFPDRDRSKSLFLSEREAIDRILSDSTLSDQSAGASACRGVGFQIDRDLQVFCGGACDSGGILAAVPEMRDEFQIGKLDESGFEPLLDRFLNAPPRAIRLLQTITWGELATRYGDRTNDEVFWLNDLPEHKWASRYLLNTL